MEFALYKCLIGVWLHVRVNDTECPMERTDVTALLFVDGEIYKRKANCTEPEQA